jgi:hypothetical protein
MPAVPTTAASDNIKGTNTVGGTAVDENEKRSVIVVPPKFKFKAQVHHGAPISPSIQVCPVPLESYA